VPGRRNRERDRSARETQILGWILVVPAMAAVGALILYPLVKGFQQSIQ
jgi:ABC-type sugar transport system permease subunit